MAPPTSDVDWINRLSRQHDFQKRDLRALNDEYELRSPRMYMHPEILRELGDRLKQVVIAWPQLVVDSLEERLDIEGFRQPDDDAGDDDLWRVWQENGCDEQSQMAHVDALVMRRSYIAVGTNEDDDTTPLVTFESPLEVFCEIDPRTRKVVGALRRYQDADALMGRKSRYATLYLPNKTVYYEADRRNNWAVVDQDDHNLGAVPVVPIINRSRLSDQTGRSELTPILPIAHAANKLATDMMVAAEFVALPLRAIFGVNPEDMEDPDGNPVTAMQAMLGRLLMFPDADGAAKPHEFTSANLGNFHNSINQLAQLVASIAGLPPHYLGMATDNPPSADAIRSNEARLVKRAERRQRAFGGAHEQAMRLVRRFQSGDWDPKLRRLETIWRDASTPTIAQKADAAVKLRIANITTLRQAREDLGYTDAQIARMEADQAREDAATSSIFKLPTAAEQAQNVPAVAPVPAVPAVAGAAA